MEPDDDLDLVVPQKKRRMSLVEISEDPLLHIFGLLDTKSLLSCRSVCAKWNTLILENAALMRRVTVKVPRSCETFLKSQLATSVKSISFCETLENTSQAKFFVTIGRNVEKVTFEDGFVLSEEEDGASKKVFSALMSSCSKLKDLDVGWFNLELLRKLTKKEVNVTGKGIKRLTFSIDKSGWIGGYSGNSGSDDPDDGADGLDYFILSLPNLSCLRILDWNGADDSDNSYSYSQAPFTPRRFVKTLQQHMVQFPNSLKEVHFSFQLCGYILDGEMLKLLVIADQHNVKLVFNGTVDLTGLYDNNYKSAMLNFTENTFSPVKEGVLNVLELLSADVASITHLGLCTSLTKLRLNFCSPNSAALTHLSKLRNLRKLDMFQCIDFGEEFYHFGPDLVGLLLASPLILLESLEIGPNIFRPAVFQDLHKIFPNANGLRFVHCHDWPIDIVSSLAKCERLTSIVFQCCELPANLMTQQTDVSDNGQVKAAPTMTKFKCLREIAFSNCRGLTIIGLRDGVLSCQTLKEFRIYSPSKERVMHYTYDPPVAGNLSVAGVKEILVAAAFVIQRERMEGDYWEIVARKE